MRKILELLKSIEGDKWAHFLVCLLIATSIGFWVELTFKGDSMVSAIIGCLIALTIGLGKELRDSHVAGDFFSWKDFLADSIGCIFGFVLVLIFG